MRSVRGPMFVMGLGVLFIWSGMADATTGGRHRQRLQLQRQQQQLQRIRQQVPAEDQSVQQDRAQKLKRIALILSYLKHKSESQGRIVKVIKAKLVTKRLTTLVSDMEQKFAETDLDVERVAKVLKIKVLRYAATTAAEQEEDEAECSFVEKLKAAVADRAGEEMAVQGITKWTEKILERVTALREEEGGAIAKALLDRFQTRIEGLKSRAAAALDAQCTCVDEASACVVRDWNGNFLSSAVLDQYGCDAIRCDTLSRNTACEGKF